jgi:methionyl-tRNA synthetase
VAAQIVKALAIISEPFIPFAAEELWKTLNLKGSVHEKRWNEALKPLKAKHKIAKAKPLFQKIEAKGQELDENLQKIRKNLARTS